MAATTSTAFATTLWIFGSVCALSGNCAESLVSARFAGKTKLDGKFQDPKRKEHQRFEH
jgi:hypothetical protein